MSLNAIIEEITHLTIEERKHLINVIVDSFTEIPSTKKKRSILELRGLGKEIWQDIDAQDYVNELRDEWDHRP